jgi:class 3 adenylate cyclase/chromosome segregation ATPase
MDDEKLSRLWEPGARTGAGLAKLRTPITVLFSDIKGSTSYAEKKGDVEYMAMLTRHNSILFPVIEAEGGAVVKTIGDSILAKFDDPVAAVRAAAGMQRALAKDREGHEEIDQIHIRIGLHYGMGLVKDNDVFGDVVNAAAHVQHQAKTEQILITDALLDAVRAARLPFAKMGRAELKGKDEPIDLYAVAWSESETQQLIEEIQALAESNFNELKKQLDGLEEEFAATRDQWWTERRALNAELEELAGAFERARETARQQLSDDLQADLRFQIKGLLRAKEQFEQDLASARQRSEAERNNLKAQISSMQKSIVDAMERSNNPARMSVAAREQLEEHVTAAKRESQLQWERERSRLQNEIERLKKAASTDEKREAARHAVLEKLGKLPTGPAGRNTADRWEREFQDARLQWQIEREQLNLAVKKLEMDLQRNQSSMRSEVFQEMRTQFESKLAEANLERDRLEQEVQFVTSELASERQRLNARIKILEEALPEAQEAARKQVQAELQSQCDSKVQEANRVRARVERKHRDLLEEWEGERRRTKKQIATLEEQLKEAREAAFMAQKTSDRARTSD